MCRARGTVLVQVPDPLVSRREQAEIPRHGSSGGRWAVATRAGAVVALAWAVRRFLSEGTLFLHWGGTVHHMHISGQRHKR